MRSLVHSQFSTSTLTHSPMAEGVTTPTANDVLKRIEKHVICPACQAVYDQPRTLPCWHSFCLACLQQLPLSIQHGKYYITCPTCSQSTRLPKNGAVDFRPAVLVNNFLKIRGLLIRFSNTQSHKARCDSCHKEQADGFCRPCCKFFCQPCVDVHTAHPETSSHEMCKVEDLTNPTIDPVIITTPIRTPSPVRIVRNEDEINNEPVMMCETHTDVPLDLYCDTCEELMCPKCTDRHEGHQYDLVSNVFERHKREIEDSLVPVKHKQAIVQATLDEIDRRSAIIVEQGEALKRQITETMHEKIVELREVERTMTHEVQAETQEKLELLGQERDEVHYELAQLLLTALVVMTHGQ